MTGATTAFINSPSAAVFAAERPLFDHARVKSATSLFLPFAFDWADSGRFWAACLRSVDHVVLHNDWWASASLAFTFVHSLINGQSFFFDSSQGIEVSEWHRLLKHHRSVRLALVHKFGCLRVHHHALVVAWSDVGIDTLRMLGALPRATAAAVLVEPLLMRVGRSDERIGHQGTLYQNIWLSSLPTRAGVWLGQYSYSLVPNYNLFARLQLVAFVDNHLAWWVAPTWLQDRRRLYRDWHFFTKSLFVAVSIHISNLLAQVLSTCLDIVVFSYFFAHLFLINISFLIDSLDQIPYIAVGSKRIDLSTCLSMVSLLEITGCFWHLLNRSVIHHLICTEQTNFLASRKSRVVLISLVVEQRLDLLDWIVLRLRRWWLLSHCFTNVVRCQCSSSCKLQFFVNTVLLSLMHFKNRDFRSLQISILHRASLDTFVMVVWWNSSMFTGGLLLLLL